MTIFGTAGDDALVQGTTGNDTIDGLVGQDTFVGLAGDDTYIINSSGDLAVEAPNEGVDTVLLANYGFFRLPDNIENLTLTGSDDNKRAGKLT